MDIITIFPFKVFLNLARRQDRRTLTEIQFRRQGLTVARFPAVDAKRLRQTRGYESPARYAHALSMRLALRKAWHAGAQAILFFEDDVQLVRDFLARCSELELPDNWGMFYLGCQHHERPDPVSHGVVKVKFAIDTHAVAIHRSQFRSIMNALNGGGKRSFKRMPATDVILAGLQARITTYAAYPNLAWQGENQSDIAVGTYSNYEPSGEQRPSPTACTGVLAEVLGGKAWKGLDRTPVLTARLAFQSQFPGHIPLLKQAGQNGNSLLLNGPLDIPKPAHPAFLFLTRSALNNPIIWTEYFNGKMGNCSIYGHAANRDGLSDPVVANKQIYEHLPTEWGDISLIRAQLALLKSALENECNTHFVFLSESCVPVRPLPDFLRILNLDGRSRFACETLDDLAFKGQRVKADRVLISPKITAKAWRFHSQWILLNREAAETAVEDDFTKYFENVTAPDEAYFGTVLNMKGFPLETRVARQDTTWLTWDGGNAAHPRNIQGVAAELAGEILGSGCFFARKFGLQSDIGKFGLHNC